jgi:two-component system sensor histidine kinase MprB
MDDALGKLAVVLVVSGLLGVVLACLAGLAVARTEHLRPVPVNGSDDVARLAGAFNDTLQALAVSRDRQRRLIADAGHELRTPLTSLRTNLELLMQSDARGALSAQSRRELMSDVQEQLDELSTLIRDVTELGREDVVPSSEPVDLGQVVERAATRVRRRALTQTVVVDAAPWWVHGERVALERRSPTCWTTRSSGTHPKGRCALNCGTES